MTKRLNDLPHPDSLIREVAAAVQSSYTVPSHGLIMTSAGASRYFVEAVVEVTSEQIEDYLKAKEAKNEM